MTDHEMLLLRAAVESFEHGGDILIERRVSDWYVSISEAWKTGDTLANALTALLRDLGADVPEWPSAERVAILKRGAPNNFAHYARLLTLPEYLPLRGGS